jgi:hypothetical protein
MRSIYQAVTVAVAVATMSATIATALPYNKYAFHKYSRSRLISIGNQICGPHGNRPACCRFNGGIWQVNPPAHCENI